MTERETDSRVQELIEFLSQGGVHIEPRPKRKSKGPLNETFEFSIFSRDPLPHFFATQEEIDFAYERVVETPHAHTPAIEMASENLQLIRKDVR